LVAALRSRRRLLAGLCAATLGLTLTEAASIALVNARPEPVHEGGELIVVTRGALQPIDAQVISRSGSDHLGVCARLAR
jgi:hypothetical protein